ncbi:MAG TPA: hypothetical protein VKA36_10355 [Solirubrobacterales bacterium]|nr:hypothetical protein [Solirubrobacterales bacterium]
MSTRRSAGSVIFAAALALLATPIAGLTLAAERGGAARAGVAASERVEIATIPPERRAFEQLLPITRKPGAKMRSIASLSLGSLGSLSPGKRLEGGAELSVSVCLKPNRNHNPDRDDCKGKMYGYDPDVLARLIVAGQERDTGGADTLRLGRDARVRCTQKQPARNHHCVLTVRWRKVDTAELQALPCAPNSCMLNLVAGASHKRARSGQKVIVGGIEGNGKVDNKGVAKVSAVLYGSEDFVKPKPKKHRRVAKRLRIVDEGEKIGLEAVYSVKIPRPRAGEKLVVEGRYAASIRGNPYNVRARTQIILTDGPKRNDPTRRRAAKVALESTRMAEENNFNCTLGSSGHKTPCPVTKPAVISFLRSSNKPVYVNLIAGHGALLREGQKWHKGDKVKIVKKGYLKVWRYPAS